MAIALGILGYFSWPRVEMKQTFSKATNSRFRRSNFFWQPPGRRTTLSKIDFSATQYVLTFEEGEQIRIDRLLIHEIEFDSLRWLADFHFHDQSSQQVNFIGKLNLSGSDVILNPYLTCPLAAMAKFETPVKGMFKIIIHGKAPGGVTIVKSYDHFSEFHELPILGLYESLENKVEFVFMNKNGEARCSKVAIISTPEIQDKPAFEIQIIKEHSTTEYQGLYFISNLRLAFDQAGEIRWYYNGEGRSFFGKLRNGNFVISTEDNLYFHEVTMTGQLVKKYYVPNQLHHEIVELPWGNFLVAAHSPPGPPNEDVVVEIDRNSGAVVKTWDFNTILDPSRQTLPSTQAGDWLHVNAMYYDESDNSFVICGRSQSAVIKIDYATSTIKWILSNHNHWTQEFQPYLLHPVDALGNAVAENGIDFWPYGPHATQKLPNGNLLLYDNGDYRGFYDNPDVPQESYTRAVEYKIDAHQKTVQLVWQFDNSKTVFTKFTGYVQNLPGTNTRLMAYMWVTPQTPRILEIDANDKVIFDAMMNPGKVSYYRTMKFDLYEGID